MKNTILAIFIMLCAFSSQAFGQSVKPLSIQGGLGGGLSLGQSDLSDYNGYNLGGKLKLDVKMLPVKVVGHVHYNSLEDDQQRVLTQLGAETEDVSVEIVSVGAGIEYSVLPIPLIHPYVSADAAMNFFSGDQIDSFSRFGCGFGVGTEISLPVLPITFDIEAKYRLNNLIGKDDGEGTSNHIQLWAQVLFDLF
ncbi:outer membrane beta-barrel protein [Chloroherpeton thalassium]|nr:outer membrane beta-barrel protein [Chloroherpeton thalassium]